MKCKNCETENEKGKFCNECGFPLDEQKKSRSQEAYEALQDLTGKVNTLVEEKTERDLRRKEREEKEEEKKNAEEKSTVAGKFKRSIIPDLF